MKSSKTDPNEAGAEICYVPLSKLRTSYAPLRVGLLKTSTPSLQLLPVRVVATNDGHYEIIDGFKRLSFWKSKGRDSIPVVIESSGSAIDYKRQLLESNTVKRSLTTMDEAKVVQSLKEEDKKSLSDIAKFLRHKKDWVSSRLSMATNLSLLAQKQLAEGKFGPTLANYLTSLPSECQDRILDCFSTQKLSHRDKLLVLQSYRMADEQERKSLLENPFGILKESFAPKFSQTFHIQEERLQKATQAITELQSFFISSDIDDAERRRLEALFHNAFHYISNIISEIAEKYNSMLNQPKQEEQNEPTQEKTYAIQRSEPNNFGCDSRIGPEKAQQAENIGRSGGFTRACCESPSEEGVREIGDPRQAFALSERDQRTGSQGIFSQQNISGNEGVGLRGRSNDSCEICESDTISNSTSEAKADQTEIRDMCWAGDAGGLVVRDSDDREKAGQDSRFGNSALSLPEAVLCNLSQ